MLHSLSFLKYKSDPASVLRCMKQESKLTGIRGIVDYTQILYVHFSNEMAHFIQNFRGIYFHRKAKIYSLSSSCLSGMKGIFHDLATVYLASLIVCISLPAVPPQLTLQQYRTAYDS